MQCTIAYVVTAAYVNCIGHTFFNPCMCLHVGFFNGVFISSANCIPLLTNYSTLLFCYLVMLMYIAFRLETVARLRKH